VLEQARQALTPVPLWKDVAESIGRSAQCLRDLRSMRPSTPETERLLEEALALPPGRIKAIREGRYVLVPDEHEPPIDELAEAVGRLEEARREWLKAMSDDLTPDELADVETFVNAVRQRRVTSVTSDTTGDHPDASSATPRE